MNHLYQDRAGIIHACESSEVHPGITLVWTKCERDVPANTSFKSAEKVTCKVCLGEAPPPARRAAEEAAREINAAWCDEKSMGNLSPSHDADQTIPIMRDIILKHLPSPAGAAQDVGIECPNCPGGACGPLEVYHYCPCCESFIGSSPLQWKHK